jgi:ribonuclease P/MRP protein subunit POP5
MKHLPKHLRPRWRYLAVAVETEPDVHLGGRRLQQAVWGAGRALLGDPGSADVDLRVIRSHLSPGGGEVLIRVRRGAVNRGRAAIACVSDIDGDSVGLYVRGVAGTARAAEEKYMNGATRLADEERVVLDTAVHRAVPRGDSRIDLRDGGSIVGATTLDLG